MINMINHYLIYITIFTQPIDTLYCIRTPPFILIITGKDKFLLYAVMLNNKYMIELTGIFFPVLLKINKKMSKSNILFLTEDVNLFAKIYED